MIGDHPWPWQCPHRLPSVGSRPAPPKIAVGEFDLADRLSDHRTSRDQRSVGDTVNLRRPSNGLDSRNGWPGPGRGHRNAAQCIDRAGAAAIVQSVDELSKRGSIGIAGVHAPIARDYPTLYRRLTRSPISFAVMVPRAYAS